MGVRVKGKLSEHRGGYICTKTIICKFKYWTPKQLYISLDIGFSNITFKKKIYKFLKYSFSKKNFILLKKLGFNSEIINNLLLIFNKFVTFSKIVL